MVEGGEGPPVGAVPREVPDAGLPAEGYSLDAGPDGIELRYADEAGRRYGRATLDQLHAGAAGVPGVRIRDWPDVAVRGYMLDISRDRVPTRHTLERLIEVMSIGRLNQLQLYTEHTFAYRDHEVVWRDASPITPEDVAWLDERCRAAGIELVANQNCFGHMGRWLRHDEYRSRAETPDGFEPFPGITQPPTVLAPTPDNAAFALGLLAELLPNFTSRRVHIGCDETFELGLGASREDVARRGKVPVYVEHLHRLIDPLAAEGREVLFWDDIARKDPSTLAGLPPSAVAVVWSYEMPDSPVRPAEMGPIADLEIDLPGDGMAPLVAPMAEAGIPFWVAPGTSSWNSLVGRIDNAVGNLVDAAAAGLAYGAGGYLITDWGDGGHLQPPSISFGPMILGGALSWCLEANRDVDVAEALDHLVFGDATGSLGSALDRIGRVWAHTGKRAFNGSPLDVALSGGGTGFITGEADPALVSAVLEELDGALASIGRSRPACGDAEVVRDELEVATLLARHAAWRMGERAGVTVPSVAERIDDLTGLVERQRGAWLARSRPGGLEDSLGRLRSPLRKYLDE
jgi:hexosaminidase